MFSDKIRSRIAMAGVLCSLVSPAGASPLRASAESESPPSNRASTVLPGTIPSDQDTWDAGLPQREQDRNRLPDEPRKTVVIYLEHQAILPKKETGEREESGPLPDRARP